MKKLLLNLLGKEIMEKVKIWLKENGFVGFLALAIAAAALFLGWTSLFWASIGGFVGKNWEIVRKLWNENVKHKL